MDGQQTPRTPHCWLYMRLVLGYEGVSVGDPLSHASKVNVRSKGWGSIQTVCCCLPARSAAASLRVDVCKCAARDGEAS